MTFKLKEWIAKITARLSEETDYVIENGTKSDWTYRKWKSGKKEAWKRFTVTGSATSTAGSTYRSTFSFSIPSGIFSSTPSCTYLTISNAYNNVISVQGNASSATAVSGNIFRTTASTSTYTVYIGAYIVDN